MACSTLPGGVLYSSSAGPSACLPRREVYTSVWSKPRRFPFVVKAVSAPEEEECAPAPEKEVGKVSMEWKAEENTKLLGTYPPISKKKWTGYIEKDTAGQTNIYAVEPTVYVSENVISSNTAGDSSMGSEQTIVVSLGLAVGLLFGAGVVLQWVSSSSSSSSSSTPVASDVSSYTGPSLSYYIQKFKPSIVEATAPSTVDEPAFSTSFPYNQFGATD